MIGALATLVLSGVFRVGLIANEKGCKETCVSCRGRGAKVGVTWVDSFSGRGRMEEPCEACSGRGFVWILDRRCLAATSTFIGDLAIVAMMAFTVGVAKALRVVECRPCDGSRCLRCNGKGLVTAADLWAA